MLKPQKVMNPKNFLHSYLHNFEILNNEEVNFISSKFRIRKVKKYAYLFKEGERAEQYNLVAKGALRLYYMNDDFKEFSLRFAFEEQWIGDLDSFTATNASNLNLQAMENTIVYQIDRSDQKLLLHEIPKLYRIFLFKFEERLLEANKRILLNISATAEERFDEFINNYGNYYNRIPDRHIASFIGVTPEFFSKLKNAKLKEYLQIN